MNNNGKEIEDIVGAIEKAMKPNFDVQVRKRILDETGKQIAEFDIEISGEFEALPIRVLIECRDRPSGGPQGAAWIEQLIGRRARFGFSTVIAVSSTGFARPAIDLAQEQGIVLRKLVDISRIANSFDIAECKRETGGGIEISFLKFLPGSIPQFHKTVGQADQSDFQNLLSLNQPLIIRTADTDKFVEFPGRFLSFLEDKHLNWYAEPNVDVEETFSEIIGPLELKLPSGRIISLDRIEADLVFVRKHFCGKMFRVWDYSESGKRIGYYAIYVTKTPIGSFQSDAYVPIDSDGREEIPRVPGVPKVWTG